MVKVNERLHPDRVARGDVWLADLRPIKGHEIDKERPVLVVQNDIANAHSPCVTVVPITTYAGGKTYPTEVLVKAPEGGLRNDSLIQASQIRTIDREKRLSSHLGQLSPQTLAAVEQALRIHLGFVRL